MAATLSTNASTLPSGQRGERLLGAVEQPPVAVGVVRLQILLHHVPGNDADAPRGEVADPLDERGVVAGHDDDRKDHVGVGEQEKLPASLGGADAGDDVDAAGRGQFEHFRPVRARHRTHAQAELAVQVVHVVRGDARVDVQLVQELEGGPCRAHAEPDLGVVPEPCAFIRRRGGRRRRQQGGEQGENERRQQARSTRKASGWFDRTLSLFASSAW